MSNLIRMAGAMLVLSILHLSCQKDSDFTPKSLTTTTSSDASVDLSGCKIRRIWADYGGGRVTGLFTYNSKGNPISVLYNSNGTGNPNHFFKYDSQNRLWEWSLTYPGDVTVERHRYKYNSAGVAIADTATYTEGDTVVNVSTFVYDSWGRIVKETIKNIKNTGGALQPTTNPTFTYDSRGNLATRNWRSSWYDYKVNPLRTNPIFQFIFRNWSQNNAYVQAKYNSKGLPLSMNPTNDVFFNAITTFVVVYDCE